MIQNKRYVMILLNMPELAAWIGFLKYFDSPFFSLPSIRILMYITREVKALTAIHHNMPVPPPRPKIPAETPENMFEITRHLFKDWSLKLTEVGAINSIYFSLSSRSLVFCFFSFSFLSMSPAGTLDSARKSLTALLVAETLVPCGLDFVYGLGGIIIF